MSTAYNGRIDAAQKEGKNLKVVWNGSIYDLDYWAIPKGSPNKDAGDEVHRVFGVGRSRSRFMRRTSRTAR